MSNQNIGNPTVWVAVEPNVAAGYVPDELGQARLVGLVIYEPEIATLRDIPLRRLKQSDDDERALAAQAWGPYAAPGRCHHLGDPPTAEQVRRLHDSLGGDLLQNLDDVVTNDAWADYHGERREIPSETVRTASSILGDLDTDDEGHTTGLTRQPNEDPDTFYARIGRLHASLSAVSRRPTEELARLAGVKRSTAAAWVSRARARGLYPNTEGEQ